MSKNQRIRQRAQRKEKRQIRATLRAQNQKTEDTPSIICSINASSNFKSLNLPGNFINYAIKGTRRDIQENLIEGSRIPALEKAMKLNKKIERKRTK